MCNYHYIVLNQVKCKDIRCIFISLICFKGWYAVIKKDILYSKFHTFRRNCCIQMVSIEKLYKKL